VFEEFTSTLTEPAVATWPVGGGAAVMSGSKKIRVRPASRGRIAEDTSPVGLNVSYDPCRRRDDGVFDVVENRLQVGALFLHESLG